MSNPYAPGARILEPGSRPRVERLGLQQPYGQADPTLQ